MTKRQVIETIRNPDASYEDRESEVLVAVKRTKNRYLVVLYVVEDERNRIVTLYHASAVDRLIRRKLERGVWVVRA